MSIINLYAIPRHSHYCPIALWIRNRPHRYQHSIIFTGRVRSHRYHHSIIFTGSIRPHRLQQCTGLTGSTPSQLVQLSRSTEITSFKDGTDTSCHCRHRPHRQHWLHRSSTASNVHRTDPADGKVVTESSGLTSVGVLRSTGSQAVQLSQRAQASQV
jgi:hypothetical protein